MTVKITVSSNGSYFPFDCVDWFVMCNCQSPQHEDPPLKGQSKSMFKTKDFDS